MRAKMILVAALLVVTALGCGGSASNDASPSVATATVAATATPTSEYVVQVNTLCAELLADLLEVTTPHPGSFPIADYNAERSKIQPLVEEFDAKVASIPLTPADQPAADAFDAFRRMADATDAELAAAAATGDQDLFDAAVAERHETFDASTVLQDLGTAGIICNAR